MWLSWIVEEMESTLILGDEEKYLLPIDTRRLDDRFFGAKMAPRQGLLGMPLRRPPSSLIRNVSPGYAEITVLVLIKHRPKFMCLRRVQNPRLVL